MSPAVNAYAGIGSRQTPDHVLELMYYIAQKLGKMNVALRSGGAPGADYAFEAGCNAVNGPKEIFYAKDVTNAALGLAARFHPAWGACKSYYVKSLHARNCFQILGRELIHPCQAVICWTPDACISHSTRCKETGGTGTAISIAEHCFIPVHNLAIESHFIHWKKFVEEG